MLHYVSNNKKLFYRALNHSPTKIKPIGISSQKKKSASRQRAWSNNGFGLGDIASSFFRREAALLKAPPPKYLDSPLILEEEKHTCGEKRLTLESKRETNSKVTGLFFYPGVGTFRENLLRMLDTRNDCSVIWERWFCLFHDLIVEDVENWEFLACSAHFSQPSKPKVSGVFE